MVTVATMVENEFLCVMKRVLFLAAVLWLIISCSVKKGTPPARGETIDMLREVCTTQQVDYTLHIIDSLEQAGEMRPPVSDYWRGLVYDMGWRYRLASYYYQRSFDAYHEPITDWNSYFETGYRLACMKVEMQDFDDALYIATKLLGQSDSLSLSGSKVSPGVFRAFLLSMVSDIQFHLGQEEEARHSCQMAYDALVGDSNSDSVDRLTMCAGNTKQFADLGDLEEASMWLQRSEESLRKVERQLDEGRDIAPLVFEYRQRISLLRAIILQACGSVAEAARVYASIPEGDLMRLPSNIEAAISYLKSAGRYDEALTLMNRIDTLSPVTERPRMTFDIIRTRLVPKYEVLLKTGRKDEALSIGKDICESIDSAFIAQIRSNAAELSIIYGTQLKDHEIQRKENERRIHMIIIMGLLLLLVISSIALWRIIIAGRHLREKNRALFDTIQSMSKKEEIPQKPAAQSSLHKLYCQLTELMQNQHPYTDSELTRENLAQMIGTNSRYLADAIREYAGNISLGEYLDGWRIRHSAQLLADTDDPIGIIGDLSGFSSRSHFNAIFRERYKMTPSEYRKIAKEKMTV